MIYVGRMNHRQLFFLYHFSYLENLMREGILCKQQTLYTPVSYTCRCSTSQRRENISWQICNIPSYSSATLKSVRVSTCTSLVTYSVLRTLQEYPTLQWHAVLSSTENAILLHADETVSIRMQCFALCIPELVLQILYYSLMGKYILSTCSLS